MALTITGPDEQPGQWVAKKDVVETLDDGRTILKARKGTALPLTQAIQLGLVEAPTPPKSPAPPKSPSTATGTGPSETKEDGATGSGKATGPSATK